MYRMRTNIPKRHLERRWTLPERVFIVCGACHILAYAFLERYAGFPKSGHRFWETLHKHKDPKQPFVGEARNGCLGLSPDESDLAQACAGLHRQPYLYRH